MEWLNEKIIAVMFTALAAWHWYDKSLRDTRFRSIEQRIVDIENTAHAQQTQLEVMNVELKAFRKLTDVKLGHIQAGTDKILSRLEGREKHE
jgi:hypothetical protein|tara:strand:+ start:206 stop:481 length:276 start_codon:yes stop_codon:yes gene_type:complete